MDRPLNRHDYRTLSLAALGGALEFYDFVIYVFLASIIGRLFFPADMPVRRRPCDPRHVARACPDVKFFQDAAGSLRHFHP